MGSGVTPLSGRPPGQPVTGRPGAGGAPAPDAIDAQLRETARQLQGVFVQQLFQAMRETVPSENALVSGGLGEDIFRGMFDEHLAEAVPASLGDANGLTDAIVRQLRSRLAPGAADATGVTQTMSPRK